MLLLQFRGTNMGQKPSPFTRYEKTSPNAIHTHSHLLAPAIRFCPSEFQRVLLNSLHLRCYETGPGVTPHGIHLCLRFGALYLTIRLWIPIFSHVSFPLNLPVLTLSNAHAVFCSQYRTYQHGAVLHAYSDVISWLQDNTRILGISGLGDTV